MAENVQVIKEQRPLPARYEKLQTIWGEEALRRIMDSHVMVLGVGGVGSNCTEALARGGVGRITILDRDVVAESNINRQSIAFYSTLGQRKVDVMEGMIKDINPEAQVTKFFQFLRQEEMEAFLDEYARDVDYVVDAIDTISAKLKLAELAPKYSFKLISSMGGANKVQPECFKIADLYDTVNCPLCRIMRKEGRKRGITELKVLYSCEQPIDTDMGVDWERSERKDLGTASFVPPIFGQMIAGEVLRDLAGFNDRMDDAS
ncbi:tRNA threonylcarbamoyladenosine dehydratase [Anaerotardibacter muris]|uniref:tRNA threonylcarbamoyladenosine dehydratase n=1 Tax=Anaerotardibacter muris TaxID=2941505 RepID=UPI00203C27FD|nr:tRNA threonylcarbamoyladenosine dehydratase [Anaerotardibacter muris]